MSMRCPTIALAIVLLISMSALGANEKPKTKIGILDLQNQFHPYMKRLYATGNVPIQKTEGWDRIEYFKKYNPNGIVVYAMVGEEFDMQRDDPEQAARRRWEKYLAPTLTRMTDSQRKMISYVEVSPNMVVPKTVEEGKWWAKYGEVICRLVGEAGFRPMVMTSGVGGLPCSNEQELEILKAMLPALRAAHKYGGGWSYHGYSCYYTMDPETESYYSLRYRRAYEFFRKYAPDLMDMPIALSEGGIDYMGDPRRDGYAYRGTREQYAKWLAWYDSELKKDPYVLGVTLFKAAGWGWESFDLEPMEPYLLNYYNTGSIIPPKPATKMGLAVRSSNGDPSTRKALAIGGPVLYTSPDEIRPGGAIETYKVANPKGTVIVDFRSPLPNEKTVPDARKAAEDRWNQIAAVISKWTDTQRKMVDFLDTSPGPVTIRHDKDVPSPRYYADYLNTISQKVIESGFKVILETFNTSSIPADGRDWDTLGHGFWDAWKRAKEGRGAVIVLVDATYPTMDRNYPASQFHFAYKGIYRSLLRLEPELFGVPIIIMAERLDLPRVLDARGQQKLATRKQWLEWYDQQLCADIDVMAVIVNPGIEGTPNIGQKSILDWYTNYMRTRARK